MAFLDNTVAAGLASSRAALVTQAVQREMRHQAALADVRVLTTRGAADDLDDVVAWTASALSQD